MPEGATKKIKQTQKKIEFRNRFLKIPNTNYFFWGSISICVVYFKNKWLLRQFFKWTKPMIYWFELVSLIHWIIQCHSSHCVLTRHDTKGNKQVILSFTTCASSDLLTSEHDGLGSRGLPDPESAHVGRSALSVSEPNMSKTL